MLFWSFIFVIRTVVLDISFTAEIWGAAVGSSFVLTGLSLVLLLPRSSLWQETEYLWASAIVSSSIIVWKSEGNPLFAYLLHGNWGSWSLIAAVLLCMLCFTVDAIMRPMQFEVGSMHTIGGHLSNEVLHLVSHHPNVLEGDQWGMWPLLCLLNVFAWVLYADYTVLVISVQLWQALSRFW